MQLTKLSKILLFLIMTLSGIASLYSHPQTQTHKQPKSQSTNKPLDTDKLEQKADKELYDIKQKHTVQICIDNGVVVIIKDDEKIKLANKVLSNAIYGVTGFWLYVTLKNINTVYQNKLKITINEVFSQLLSSGVAATALAELYILKLAVWLLLPNEEKLEIKIHLEKIILPMIIMHVISKLYGIRSNMSKTST